MKTDVAILGSGNVGTDLMFKIERSKLLNLKYFIGIIPESEGLALAKKKGYETSAKGIDYLLKNIKNVKIVFDATTAKAARKHAELLSDKDAVVVDLTPAAVGPFVVPPVNLKEHLDKKNVNLLTCGGQAVIPIVAAIREVSEIKYAEIVSTIASKSAGPGLRQNIDEFTETTRMGLEVIGGATRGKAIMVLNPADPPIIMQNTIYAIVENSNEETIKKSIERMADKIRKYVPGYKFRVPPFFKNNQVTTIIDVEGAGDYLPTYAGNLDIISAAAVNIAEEFAAKFNGGHA